MDIFSHGIWAALMAKAANQKLNKIGNNKSLRTRQFIFFGVFPDLLSFTLSFVWLFWGLISGNLNFSNLPSPETMEPAVRDTFWIFRLTSFLYNISHSLFVLAVVFGISFLIFKRPTLELGGWLLHILIDIPTHSYKFYPTPFLWPLSNWKFDGFSWANPWFMVLNYFLIITVYLFLTKSQKISVTLNSEIK